MSANIRRALKIVTLITGAVGLAAVEPDWVILGCLRRHLREEIAAARSCCGSRPVGISV